MLPVKSIGASIPFYEKLGFMVEERNDAWGWATLSIDGCRIMLDQSINTWPSPHRQAVFYLYPDDVSAYHAEVKARGVEVPELEVTFYGMMEFRIEDLDGNRWWVGQVAATGF